MYKRILSLALAIIMLFSCLPFAAFNAFAADKPTISVTDLHASPNSTVQLDLKITNNPGIAGAKITLSFDSKLTLTDAVSNGVFSGLDFTKPGVFTSPCSFSWDSESAVATEDGTFVTLTFAVSSDAEKNESLPITVSYRNGDIYDSMLNTVNVTVENGSITIIDYIPGDVNDDKTVNGKDVTLIRRFNVGGYDVTINEDAADVNDDNVINGKDVTLIRRYIAGGYDVELKPHTPRCAHNMTATAAVAATCEEDGNIAYWYCDKCEKYYSDENGSYEITLEDTVIPTKGHTVVIDPAVPATETSTGLTEGSHCSVCHKVLIEQIEYGPLVGTEYNINYILPYTVDGYDSYLASQSIEIPTKKWKYSSQSGATLPIVSNKADVDAGRADVIAPDGYSFVGWFTAPEGGTIVTEIEAGSNGNKTYYARWRKIQYNVQYKSDVFVAKDSDTYTVDTGLTLTSPRLSNYTFVGWTDEDGTLYKNTNIPVGTTGNITLTANWTSERNKTFTKPKLDKPIIIEDEETNIIFFTYEIGEIQNVPVNTVYDFGYIAGDGVTREKTATCSSTTSETAMNSFTNSVSKATTQSSNWTLSSDWNNVTSIDEEKALQKVNTIEEAETIAKSSTDNWNVSSGTSGSTSTTSASRNTNGWSNDVKVDLHSSHENSSSDTHTDTNNNSFDINAKINYTPKTKSMGIEYKGFGINGSEGGGLGGEIGGGYKHEWGSTDTHVEGETNSVTGGFSAGKTAYGSSESSTSSTSSSSWNSSKSFGGSNTSSTSKSVANSISESIAETYGYGEEYSEGGSSSETSGLSSTQQTNDEYSSSVTFSKLSSDSVTETFTTQGTKPGYHRWVQVGKAHVFAVVGYDMKTESYFVYTYTVMDAKEPLQSFEDYSYVSGDYTDAENGVIPFEVPYEVAEYVAERTCYSKGLKVNQATGEITGYTGTDDYVVIPEYYNVGDGDVVKITGISQNAFKGNNNIKDVRLSDFITEIPENTFENCTALLGITGGSINKIGNEAFKHCTSLEVALVDNTIDSLGNNVFVGCERLMMNAANASNIVAATNSGAKKIQIYADARIIDGGTTALNGVNLSVPSTTEFFLFSGYNNTYPEFTIESGATQTVIHKTGFDSIEKTPIKTSSADFVLNQVSIKSEGWGIIFTSDNTNLLLQSIIDVDTSGNMSVLCKNLILGEYNKQVDGILNVTGKLFACGDVTNKNLLARNGDEIEYISQDKYYTIMNSLQVQFDANGGLVDVSSKWVYYGIVYGELPIPTREYYTFDGWFTDKYAGTKITADTIVSTLANHTLYAHWTLKSYTIRFNANGGTVAITDKTAYVGEHIGDLPIPTRLYYTFEGWYNDQMEGEKITSNTILYSTNDVILYAHWTANPPSDWVLENAVPENATIIDSKWTYDYTSYTSSTSSSLDGWTRDTSKGTSGVVTTYGSWGSWNGNWIKGNAPSKTDTLDVKTTTLYGWYHYRCINASHHNPAKTFYWPSKKCYAGNCGWTLSDVDYEEKYTTYAHSNAVSGFNDFAHAGYYGCDHPDDGQAWYTKDTATGYQTRSRSKTITYYYYKIESKEAFSDPTGQTDVSNVIKYVKYRVK